ncbi:MAG: YfhO family protein [Clostridia bacterium]|nr:YfhO family protein [Clostridia bacterium]
MEKEVVFSQNTEALVELDRAEPTAENTQSSEIEKDGFLRKAKNFFKSFYGYFVIPLFILLIFGVAYVCYNIWPFGTAIVSSYDMLAQICPIIEHFFDVFQGESGLFHTFHLGAGMDMFGILAFCAISPFTPLLLLAGESGSLYMVSIVLPLKYVCIALSAFIFLRKYFSKLPQYIQVVLALLYAYSGYSFVANTYIIWMDLMIYMPLVGAGIIEFSKTKKIRLLVIGLALCIYTCFSIVCFSFFTLFPVLVCYVLICKDRGEWKELLSKLALAFVVAVGVSLPVLIPSLLAYLQAGRNTGIFSSVFKILDADKINVHIYEKFSYVLSDAGLIALMVTYFFRSKKGDKLSVFLLVALLFLLIPCLVDESMMLLNMGSYNSYALRFGFLLSFYLLFVSAKAVEEYIEDGADDFEVNSTKANIAMTIIMVLSVIAILFTFGLYRFIEDGGWKDNPIIEHFFGEYHSGIKIYPFQSFFAAFAHSEGGLEGVSLLFVVVSIVFIISAIVIKLKFVKFKDVICFLCILCLSQTVFYNFSLVKGDRQSGSKQNYEYYSQMIEDVGDDEIYRLKSFDYYISSDSPMILGNYAHTLFSSMADAKNITAPKFFGYGGSLTNSTRPNRGTVFSDAFLGYKYTVFSAAHASSAKTDYYTDVGVSAHKTPSIKISYTMNGKTKTKIWKDIDANAHGKDKWTSLKITLDGSTFKGYLGNQLISSFKMVNSTIKGISAVTQKATGSFKNLSVKDDNGNELSGIWRASSTCKIEDGVYTTIKETDKITFSGDFSAVKQISADVSFSQGFASDDFIGIAVTVYDSDGKDVVYRIVVEPNVNYLLYQNDLAFPLAAVVKSGELKFDVDNKTEGYKAITAMLNDGVPMWGVSGTSVENGAIKYLQQKLTESKVEYRLEKNAIVAEPFTAEKGQMLYLNYVNLKGYTAYVNGVERELKDNSLDLMLIDLDEGENVVEIRYKSPYASFILVGLVLAIAIFILAWLAYKVKPIVFEKVSVVLPYAVVLLALAVTIFFFIFPTGVYFSKLFSSYIGYAFV